MKKVVVTLFLIFSLHESFTQMANQVLLKRVKSADIEEVYSQLTRVATEWAACGFLRESNELLEKLWSYKIPHERDTWLSDQALQVIWENSNDYPNNIPFGLSDTHKIEKTNWEEVSTPNFTSKIAANTEIDNLSGKHLLYKALILANPSDDKASQIDGTFSEAFRALDKYISEKPVGSDLYQSLLFGAVLAARTGLDVKAKYYIGLLAQEYVKNPESILIEYLMRDKATAKLLINKEFGKLTKLNKDNCQYYLQQLSKALEERLSKPKYEVEVKTDWSKLLNTLSTNAGKLEKNEKEGGTNQSLLWLGHGPAVEKTILKVEKKFGIAFPKDYRDFLLTSNGFDSFSSTGVTLLPIERIDLLKNTNPEIFDMIFEDEPPVSKSSLDKVILIGGLQEGQKLLLVHSQDNGWECWFFAVWLDKERKHKSFKSFMEYELQEQEDQLSK